MYPNPNYRTETSTGSIPAGIDGAGSVTSDTADPRYLQGSGTNFTSVFGGLTPNEWIYFPETNELRRVTAVMSDTTIQVDRSISLTTANWQSITCIMVAFSLANVGASTGQWNDKDYVAGSSEKEGSPPSSTFCDAQTFDATDTIFQITESY